MTSTLLLAALCILPTVAPRAPQRGVETQQVPENRVHEDTWDPRSCDESTNIWPDVSQLGESFGRTLAVDGNTLVVGAPQGSPGGAVYVFTRSGTSWQQQARLTAPTPVRDDAFGGAVALSGDTLAVGAAKTRVTGIGREVGRVYLFERAAGAWSLDRSFMRPSGAAAGDRFGTAVALQGGTLMVGAPGASVFSPLNGVVVVYARDATGWSVLQEIAPPGSSAGNFIRFGQTIALDGGVALIHERSRARARFYHWSGTRWAARTEVTSVSFGNASLALYGDTAAVGRAPSNTVDLYRRNGEDWVKQPTLPLPPLDPGERFGRSVALSERALVVGSTNWGSQEFDEAGCAYVFLRSGGRWNRPRRMVANNPNRTARFGIGLAMQRDSVFVGASNPLRTGTAYEFDLVTACGGLTKTPESLVAENPRLGQPWTIQVDPGSTGHTRAVILGHARGGQARMPGGQLLSLAGPQLLRSPPLGPGAWSLVVPDDRALLGATVHLQALHVGGGAPFALSNAIERRVGP